MGPCRRGPGRRPAAALLPAHLHQHRRDAEMFAPRAGGRQLGASHRERSPKEWLGVAFGFPCNANQKGVHFERSFEPSGKLAHLKAAGFSRMASLQGQFEVYEFVNRGVGVSLCFFSS